MRKRFLLSAAVLVTTLAARADLSIDPHAAPVTEPPAPASTTTRTDPTTTTAEPAPAPSAPAPAAEESAPAPVADARTVAFEQRFAHGKSVEQQGNLVQARAIFDGIIADAPDAKGSLREAGLISVQLGDNARADGYFTKLHALVPDYPMAIEALIQVNTALKHDAKVEIMLQKLKELYAAGKLREPYFMREHIRVDGGIEIMIYQFFDYHRPRYYAWVVDVYDAQHHLKRRLSVNYDPEVTAQMRKDPKLANAEQFLVVDNVMDAAAHVVRLDVYQQFLSLPDYAKARTILLEVLANGLKPIDSAAVPNAASTPPATH